MFFFELAQAQTRRSSAPGTRVEEEDGDPAARFRRLKFTNDSLTDNADGSVSIDVTTGGDVTGVGDCASGDCLDGTSDGGTTIKLNQTAGGDVSTICFDDTACNTKIEFDGNFLRFTVLSTVHLVLPSVTSNIVDKEVTPNNLVDKETPTPNNLVTGT